MDRAQDNDGWPIVRGPIEPGGEEWVLELRKTPRATCSRAIRPSPSRRAGGSACGGATPRPWWATARAAPRRSCPSRGSRRFPGSGASLLWTAAMVPTGLAGLLAGGPARLPDEKPEHRDALRRGGGPRSGRDGDAAAKAACQASAPAFGAGGLRTDRAGSRRSVGTSTVLVSWRAWSLGRDSPAQSRCDVHGAGGSPQNGSSGASPGAGAPRCTGERLPVEMYPSACVGW